MPALSDRTTALQKCQATAYTHTYSNKVATVQQGLLVQKQLHDFTPYNCFEDAVNAVTNTSLLSRSVVISCISPHLAQQTLLHYSSARIYVLQYLLGCAEYTIFRNLLCSTDIHLQHPPVGAKADRTLMAMTVKLPTLS